VSGSATSAAGAEARRRWCLEARTLADLGDGEAARLRLSDTTPVGRLPEWAALEPAARDELARVAGAVLCASRLRRTIDGRVLRPLSAAIGAARLSAVIALRPPVTPGADWHWGEDPLAALTSLGGEALVRDAALPPAVAQRLARLFGPSDTLAGVDPAGLRRAVDAARMLWRPPTARRGAAA
jgi:hypothetical protein